MGNLTATAVKAASEPGRYGDGDGLFLLVGKRGGKSWMVRVQKNGRRRDIGLGSASKVPLKLARERAGEVREQIEAGIDPVAERQKAAGIPSFRKAAEQVHAEHKSGWKNAKHKAQWLGAGRSKADAFVTGRRCCSGDTTLIQFFARARRMKRSAPRTFRQTNGSPELGWEPVISPSE